MYFQLSFTKARWKLFMENTDFYLFAGGGYAGYASRKRQGCRLLAGKGYGTIAGCTDLRQADPDDC